MKTINQVRWKPFPIPWDPIQWRTFPESNEKTMSKSNWTTRIQIQLKHVQIQWEPFPIPMKTMSLKVDVS